MRVKYIGPHTDGVIVPSLGTPTKVHVVDMDCPPVVILPGDIVDVSDHEAVRLCEQSGCWEPDGAESVATFEAFCGYVHALANPVPPADAKPRSARKATTTPTAATSEEI